ncbi:MAG: hypothetical protein AAGA27_06370 [Pseudomonadota bacterium]
MKKIYLAIAWLLIICWSASAFAYSASFDVPPKHWGFTMGYDGTVKGFTAGLSYFPWNSVIVSLSGNTEWVNGGSPTQYFFLSKLGFRKNILHQSYLTFGVNGNFGYSNGNNSLGIGHQYLLGPYMGIDHYVTRRILLSLSVMPYSYQRFTSGRDKGKITQSVFSNGAINMSYMFW